MLPHGATISVAMNGTLNTIAVSTILLVLLSVIVGRYQGYVIDRDYPLQTTTSCDPDTNTCFLSGCQPGADLSCEPYAKVEVLARDAPACLEEHACERFTCEGRVGCSVSFCSGTAVEDGERCMGEDAPEPN